MRRKTVLKRNAHEADLTNSNAESKRGPAWQHSPESWLGPNSKSLRDDYSRHYKLSQEFAKRLTVAATEDHNAKFPDGIDGKVPGFRVANGHLMHVMKKKPKQNEATNTAEGCVRRRITLLDGSEFRLLKDRTWMRVFKDGTYTSGNCGALKLSEKATMAIARWRSGGISQN
jgi:hypothetical protein